MQQVKTHGRTNNRSDMTIIIIITTHIEYQAKDSSTIWGAVPKLREIVPFISGGPHV